MRSSKVYNLLMAGLILVIFSSLLLTVFLFITRPKVAYVNTVELFQEFKQKKELEKKYSVVEKTQQQVLDSLKMSYTLKAEQLDKIGKNKPEYKKLSEEADIIKKQYYLKEREFLENNKALAEQYNQQIWKQLNAYIKDYGKEYHYNYIHGVKGDGNLLYAEEGDDITKELLTYVNEKFDGK